MKEFTVVIWSDTQSASTRARCFDMCDRYGYSKFHVSEVERDFDKIVKFDKIILQRIGANKYKLSNYERDSVDKLLHNHKNIWYDLDDAEINSWTKQIIARCQGVQVASAYLATMLAEYNKRVKIVENICIAPYHKSDLVRDSKNIKICIPSSYYCDHWINTVAIPSGFDTYYIGSMKCSNSGLIHIGELIYEEYLSILYTCDIAILPMHSKDYYSQALGSSYVESKSKIKQTECEWVGTPLIVSNLVPAFHNDKNTIVIPENSFFEKDFWRTLERRYNEFS